jgi:hypothetical protein
MNLIVKFCSRILLIENRNCIKKQTRANQAKSGTLQQGPKNYPGCCLQKSYLLLPTNWWPEELFLF